MGNTVAWLVSRRKLPKWLAWGALAYVLVAIAVLIAGVGHWGDYPGRWVAHEIIPALLGVACGLTVYVLGRRAWLPLLLEGVLWMVGLVATAGALAAFLTIVLYG
jgi:hypothetical protein